MSEPTEAQIKEFWEWCGFEHHPFKDLGIVDGLYGKAISTQQEYWIYPDGKQYKTPPPIDLNNLFKYAMPKLVGTIRVEKNSHWNNYCVTTFKPLNEVWDDDPALALFWAIWEVIKNEEDG